MAPLRFRIIHKRFGIGPESPGLEKPNSETGSLETPRTSGESANFRFLSGGALAPVRRNQPFAGAPTLTRHFRPDTGSWALPRDIQWTVPSLAAAWHAA